MKVCIDTRFLIILVLYQIIIILYYYIITYLNKLNGHLRLSSSTILEIVLKFISREMGISTWSSSSSSPSLEWSVSMSDRPCFSKLMVYGTSNFKISSEDSLAISLWGNVDSATLYTVRKSFHIRNNEISGEIHVLILDILSTSHIPSLCNCPLKLKVMFIKNTDKTCIVQKISQ